MFAGPQNESRVRKIIEALDNIHSSARANKVGPDEERAMLTPVFKKLGEMGMSGAEPVVRTPRSQTPPQWETVRVMAQQATLQDLTYAMAVYLSRIHDELYKNPNPTR
jgi:hypothetical protein